MYSMLHRMKKYYVFTKRTTKKRITIIYKEILIDYILHQQCSNYEI